MKTTIALLFIFSSLISCQKETNSSTPKSMIGTWQLITGTVIEKGDTLITDYTKNISFIKIINETHFAFLQHDLSKGKDSSSVFASGGGSYLLKDNVYSEHLEYCSAREWEGNDFNFTVTLTHDTLTQQGIEKVETAGVNQINIEKYVRVKK